MGFQRFVKFVRSSSKVCQKFVKSLSEVRQVCQKFVTSSSSSSEVRQVRQDRQKFVKFARSSSKVRQEFVRSSSNSSEAWVGVLLGVKTTYFSYFGGQNSLFFWFWVAKQLILLLKNEIWRTWRTSDELLTNFWRTSDELLTNFWRTWRTFLTNLTNFWRTWRTSDKLLTNFWRTSDELDEILTNFWRTWRTSDELDELLTCEKKHVFVGCSEVPAIGSCCLFLSVGLSENVSAETVRLKLCEFTKLKYYMSYNVFINPL